MNALENDEIEQSDFTGLHALTTLFASLKHSIKRDKEDAQKTRASAVAAH